MQRAGEEVSMVPEWPQPVEQHTRVLVGVWKRLSKISQPWVMIGAVIVYLCVMSSLGGQDRHSRSAARGQAKIIPVREEKQ